MARSAPLSPTARTWLKGIHILFTSAWVGAAVCMIMLMFIGRPTDGSVVASWLNMLKLIDDWVIIPAAMGSLLTGLLISWLTPWGFFKWRWVTVKWIATIAIILFGTFFLGPRLNGMAALATADPLAALQNPLFISSQRALDLVVGPQLLILLSLVLISAIKPWKQATKAGRAPRVAHNPSGR